MSKAAELQWIQEVIATTYRAAGMTGSPAPAGPVPLNALIEELPAGVTHKEVDGLNRAAASALLSTWNVRWAAIPPDDPPLAGFVYANSRSAFLFVRRGDSLPRRRFTIAHELGHYCLHLAPEIDRGESELIQVDGAEEIQESDPGGLAAMERQANRFAAELLMPEATCRILFDRYARKHGAIERFLTYHLAADLLVSRSAIAWRLYELDLIDRPAWLGRSTPNESTDQAPPTEVG